MIMHHYVTIQPLWECPETAARMRDPAVLAALGATSPPHPATLGELVPLIRETLEGAWHGTVILKNCVVDHYDLRNLQG